MLFIYFSDASTPPGLRKIFGDKNSRKKKIEKTSKRLERIQLLMLLDATETNFRGM